MFLRSRTSFNIVPGRKQVSLWSMKFESNFVMIKEMHIVYDNFFTLIGCYWSPSKDR